jgi:membrane protein required for colicin V production
LIYGFIAGFKRGLVMELAILVGIFLGIFLAITFSDKVEIWLRKEENLSGPWLAHLSFLLVFVGVYVLAWLGGKSLSAALKLMMLGIFNRIAGGVFGVFKMLMVCSVLISLIRAFDLNMISKEHKKESSMYETIGGFAEIFFPKLKETLPEPKPTIEDLNINASELLK